MSERLVGTISRGVRAPIIREGDDIAKIVVDSVLACAIRFKDFLFCLFATSYPL